MKRSDGGEGIEGKYRKDKGHDLWYRVQANTHARAVYMARGLVRQVAGCENCK